MPLIAIVDISNCHICFVWGGFITIYFEVTQHSHWMIILNSIHYLYSISTSFTIDILGKFKINIMSMVTVEFLHCAIHATLFKGINKYSLTTHWVICFSSCTLESFFRTNVEGKYLYLSTKLC